jgi:hypothetical protein
MYAWIRLGAAVVIAAFPMLTFGNQPADHADGYLISSVRSYSDSMAQLERGQGGITVGDIYVKGLSLGEKLLEFKGSGELVPLEAMSEEDYAFVQQHMKGFFVFREEIVGVEPKMTFFKELAARRGSQEDVDFFDLMTEVYGDGIWPAYVEQQTDYSGCDSYGDGARTRIYLDAVKIRTPVNEAYRIKVDEMIKGLKESFITDGICVCGGADAVIRELSLFIEKAPDADFIEDVKQLLAKVKAGKPKMKFYCQTG